MRKLNAETVGQAPEIQSRERLLLQRRNKYRAMPETFVPLRRSAP
jgi:hypothetical protein